MGTDRFQEDRCPPTTVLLIGASSFGYRIVGWRLVNRYVLPTRQIGILWTQMSFTTARLFHWINVRIVCIPPINLTVNRICTMQFVQLPYDWFEYLMRPQKTNKQTNKLKRFKFRIYCMFCALRSCDWCHTGVQNKGGNHSFFHICTSIKIIIQTKY